MNTSTVNDSNLISYIKDSIERVINEYNFELLDDITINHIEASINQYLNQYLDIHDYSVRDNVDNNEFRGFNISIQTAPSLEYINFQCNIFPSTQHYNISNSKQKRIQIELDDKLFQM